MDKVIIIGSGPAGLTAAIYLARADLKPLVIQGKEPGGQLIWTSEVENFPGFPEGIMGPKLMQNMLAQAKKYGTKLVSGVAKNANLSQKPYKIITESNEYEAEAIIIATGARSRMLELPNEDKLFSKGIHTCATCDGAFYRDKEVMIVGGGDSAMEEATFLTKFTKKVYVSYRKDKLPASKVMQDKAMNNEKIEFLLNTEIKEYIGSDKLEAVKYLNNSNNEEKEIKIDGIFLAIGHIPNTEIFENQLKLGKNNYIEPINNVFTEKEGIFVAGDVADWKYRQAITASGLGCMAALEAEKYLS